MLGHVAIVAVPVDLSKSFSTVNSIIKSQIKLKIPIVTIYLKVEDYSKEWVDFFRSLDLNSSQIKLSVFGKWYGLQSDLVDTIKKLQSESKDYDRFFLNFCINYDGQEEIVDACKLNARLVKSDKLDPEAITKQDIKDNIYSNLLPPNLIITFTKSLNGLLLWDSTNSRIHLEKDFENFNFEKAVNAYI